MDHILQLLERLIAFPTISADTNLPMIDWLEGYLSERGFSLHRIGDETGQKAGLFATLGPSGKGGALLSAHTDVVPVAGQNWTKDPFSLTRENDLVYGRGTTDMKGYLACVLHLADLASREKLTRPLKLALSYDEEIGCVGIRNMIGHLEKTIGLPDYCIVGEPTSMQVATGHKGKAALRVTCHGQNGHSAMATQFINALHVATDFVSEVRSLQNETAIGNVQDNSYDIPYTTFHIGKLSGGTALNMVPSTAEIEMEYRHIPAHDPADIDAGIGNICSQLNDQYQTALQTDAVEVSKINSYPGLLTASDHELVQFGQNLANSTQTVTVPFGTEAGHFSQLGITTIVCGPGSMEEQGHKPDENIHIAQLQQCHAMNEKLLASLK